MTGNPTADANTDSKTGSKLGTGLVVGAVVILVLAFGYLEKVPTALLWPMRLLVVLSIGYLVFALAQKVRATKFEGKKVIFSLILLLMLYGTFYVICLVFVKLMSKKDEAITTVDVTELTKQARGGIQAMLDGESPVQYDREVGWVHRPGYAWDGHSISEQGLRGTRLYPVQARDPEKRILCIGDSFTFGYEVGDTESFPYHGEQLVPGSEWINLGICGSGLTQSYEQYLKNGRKWGGKYVVIAFMTNNVKRTVNSFRALVEPKGAMTPLTKPFAKIVDGQFSVEPNPFQEQARYEKLLANPEEELAYLYDLDYYTWSNQERVTNPVLRTLGYVWERRNGDHNLDLLLGRAKDGFGPFRPGGDPYGSALWHPKSPGFQANVKVFDRYYADVIADGREPLIVILPSGADVEKRAKGDPPKHRALLDHFDEKGYRYFDFLDVLEREYGDKLDPKDLYVKTHFNGKSNQLIAEEIVKMLSLK
ncbi:MAG: hypothetical protein KDN19_19585 [Verrucomicrobiae bacterium]|nr:hypothetical protein [Verrucomicrobiae bacterium]